MKEYYDLRMEPKYAKAYFAESEIRDLGSIVSVRVRSCDKRLVSLEQVARKMAKTDEALVYGFRIIRQYEDQELLNSRFLQASVTKDIATTGEANSTTYDDNKGCPICTWGSLQLNHLTLSRKSIPNGLDISRTLADEWVCSEKFIKAFEQMLAEFAICSPILKPASNQQTAFEHSKGFVEGFYQLRFLNEAFRIVEPSRFGNHVIEDGRDLGLGICPLGHTLGLKQLSILYLEQVQWAGPVAKTLNGWGCREGLFRPESAVIVSQEFYRKWTEGKFYGLKFDVVHVQS